MQKSPAQKMKEYRARLRESGLRPLQIWVPDVTAPNFAKQARMQSRRVARSKYEDEALDFIEAATEEMFD